VKVDPRDFFFGSRRTSSDFFVLRPETLNVARLLRTDPLPASTSPNSGQFRFSVAGRLGAAEVAAIHAWRRGKSRRYRNGSRFRPSDNPIRAGPGPTRSGVPRSCLTDGFWRAGRGPAQGQRQGRWTTFLLGLLQQPHRGVAALRRPKGALVSTTPGGGEGGRPRKLPPEPGSLSGRGGTSRLGRRSNGRKRGGSACQDGLAVGARTHRHQIAKRATGRYRGQPTAGLVRVAGAAGSTLNRTRPADGTASGTQAAVVT